MRIQLLQTGQILNIAKASSIPNKQNFRILDKDEISLDSNFRADNKDKVIKVTDLDDPDEALAQAKMLQRLRIENGGRIPNTSGKINFSKDTRELTSDALDNMLLEARESQRQRIEDNWNAKN